MLHTTVLPNGLKIANVTPHPITFWSQEWNEPVEVAPSGKVVNAKAKEARVGGVCDGSCGMPRENALEECGCGQPEAAALVEMTFVTESEAEEILAWCYQKQAVPVGSIIAAQAYPGRVVAMTPAPGYERVAVPLAKPVQDAINTLIDSVEGASAYTGYPASDKEKAAMKVLQGAMAAPTKRMNPNKFTVFPSPIEDDGVYAVKDGKHVKIDTFTWGYEGKVPVAAAKVIRQDNTNCLAYGPGVGMTSEEVVWPAK